MSQSPTAPQTLQPEHPYALAAAQLNKLIRAGKSFSGHERNCCFLNVGDASFANASAVSGFDFDDDARAVAKCDWDFDGDLDFWIANRTAPRVRMLQNKSGSTHHFIALRLVGRQSNRDAIGSQVRIVVTNPNATALRQSVRAGEGYLAQSSKWVHFGLGESPQLQRLEVRWPNGALESFNVPEQLDRTYTLVEGTGVCEPWTPPASTCPVGGEPISLPATGLATHNRLTAPCPLPPLNYQTVDGQTVDASDTNGAPTLVNLWAPWCAPCLTELGEWSANASQLRDAGLRVITLTVPDDPGNVEPSEQTPEQVLDRLAVPFTAGRATVELIDILQQIHNVVYDHYRPLPIPTSVLIDAQGRLAAIYKGPVSTERILQDVNSLPAESPQAVDWTALPFPGQWIATPGPHRAGLLAARLWQANYDQAALELTERLDLPGYEAQQVKARLTAAVGFQKRRETQPAFEQLQSILQAQPDEPDANFQMGTLLAEQGQLEPAIDFFQKSLHSSATPRADARANLGAALRKLGRLEEAGVQLRMAEELDSSIPAVHVNLGLLQAAQQKFEEAATSFQRALELEPTNETHHVNLAMAWVSAGKSELAREQLTTLVQAHPQSSTGRIYLSEVLVRLGQTDDAIEQLREVVRMQPDASRIWMHLGELYEQIGDEHTALDAYRQADRLLGGDARVQMRIASILATARESSLHDGAEAVRLAENAARRTQRKQPDVLEVLAAAYARAGKFDEAAQTAREALALLSGAQSDPKRQDIQRKIDRYRQGIVP